jgi:surface protein
MMIPPLPDPDMILNVSATTSTRVEFYVDDNTSNVVIDMGDGSPLLSTKTYDRNYYDYPTAGNYIIRVKGSTASVRISCPDITSVVSFGIGITSPTFAYCTSLTQVPAELPPHITSTQNMFSACISFNQDISAWDTSHLTNMSNMFYGCTSFNQPLNSWNVSNVTNMYYMFFNCPLFNQALNSWNVSNVTNMSYMFDGCIASYD